MDRCAIFGRRSGTVGRRGLRSAPAPRSHNSPLTLRALISACPAAKPWSGLQPAMSPFLGTYLRRPDTQVMDEIRQLLRTATHIAALTGAGISAESGIPTFRGPGGLWRNFRPEELATPAA